MTSTHAKPTKVLAVADRGDTQIAVESAAALAREHDAKLEVIACVEPPQDLAIIARLAGEPPDSLVAEAVAQTRAEVRARLDSIVPKLDIAFEVLVGKSYLEIIGYVASRQCDFVVKKAEPLVGMDRFLFASTDQHLLRKCPCPVWLQTEGAATRPKRILAAVDLDLDDAAEPETLQALNRRVVDVACKVAGQRPAEIIVLHAWDAIGDGMIWAFSGNRDARMSADHYVNALLDSRRKEMHRLLDAAGKAHGPDLALRPHLVRGNPETVISQQSHEIEADLVVMGTVARTGLSGVFIGNTAENIINSLECPVLAVKPEGFVSPLLR